MQAKSVAKKSIKELTQLIDNAVDFLNRAIDDFQDHSKYSIINFYTAVELFLKARLLEEHWSLVVSKAPDRQKFAAGDFVSVTFDEAIARLLNIVQSAVPESARKNFDAIRKHRNKMVHFFHEADQNSKSLIAREQLRAWYDLHKLLTVQWDPIFSDYADRFRLIEKKLVGHREFLRARFDDYADEIKAKVDAGAYFRECESCRFVAAQAITIIEALHESTCLVCGYYDKWIDYKCSKCDAPSALREGGEFTCDACENSEDDQQIFANLNEFIATPDNYFEATVPANCGDCEGYHTVAEFGGRYVCVVCLTDSDEVAACGWCGEFGTGNMEDSNMGGCTACDGSIGHYMDKDD